MPDPLESFRISISPKQIGAPDMTISPATRPNGRHPEPQPKPVMLRKPTDPPITSTAPQPYIPKSVPKRDIAWSLATGRPIPRGWLPQVLALVDEQKRIGEPRDPDTFSQMEALTMSKGMLASEDAREHGADQLGQLVDEAAAIKGEMSTVRAELDRLDEQPVTGMNSDIVTASEAAERTATVSAKVTEERDAGSLKHRRVPLGLHRFATWAALADFPVFLYFLMQVFNVDVAGLTSGDGAAWGESLVPLITSIVFALLGTAAVAIGLKFFGRDLKGYKDNDGHIQLPAGTARIIPLLFVGLATAIAIGAGIVMAYRIISDSLAAGGGITGAVILGAFFAVIVITINVVVFSVRLRDGSLQTDEIGHLAAQLEPIEQRRVELQRHVDGLAAQLPPLRVRAARIYASTLAKVGAPIKGADQLRLLARSYHQGCGSEANFASQGNPQANLIAPVISVDRSVLDDLIERLDELADVNSAPTPHTTPPVTSKRTTPAPVAPFDMDEADDLGGEW
ncbi:hypothetical protein [Nocardia brasiliensis]|uniref:hypothetical protein n=1 Tax=Nocardia brasiliensis TaxID=37326 RepID=UPI00245830D6|nr:hypothetical protein [Nocardia brasiliensis]